MGRGGGGWNPVFGEGMKGGETWTSDGNDSIAETETGFCPTLTPSLTTSVVLQTLNTWSVILSSASLCTSQIFSAIVAVYFPVSSVARFKATHLTSLLMTAVAKMPLVIARLPETTLNCRKCRAIFKCSSCRPVPRKLDDYAGCFSN